MHLLREVVTGDAAGVMRELPRIAKDPALLARYAAFAAANGQLEVLKRFHESGANILAEDQLALRLAVASGWTAVVDYLVQHGAAPRECGAALVKSAARYGHVPVLARLRDLGCDLSPCAELTDELVTKPSLAPVLQYLADVVPHGAALARLVAAIRSGSLNAVIVALPDNDLAAYGGSLLEVAARVGSPQILRHLYESGADLMPVKARVLYAAAEAGQYDVLNRLITVYGCDPGITPTAAALAAENGHIRCLELIWTTGGAKTPPSSLTLKLAAINGHDETFDYLTHAGGLDAIEGDRQIIGGMVQEVMASPPVYRPSELWSFFNEVNLEQLRRFGMHRFKRSVNQNYFNYLPMGLRDPQLVGLLKHFLKRPPLRGWFAARMTDPDRYRGSGHLMAPDDRIFRLGKELPVLAPLGRWLQRKLYGLLVGLLWRYMVRDDALRLRDGLQEPALGSPIATAMNDRLVSQDLAHSILECNSFLDGIPETAERPPLRIAEIGAGYGRVGDVLLSSRRCRYFVFDIPPSLYVSQWYLSRRHPFKRIFAFRHFERFEDVRVELEAADIAFFTPNQVALFPDGYFDIAVNISSLHEMRNEQMRHMLAQMYRIARQRVFIKQYRQYTNPWDKIEITEKDYFVPEGWQKRLWRTDPVDSRFFEAVLECNQPAPAAQPPLGQPSAAARRPTVSVLFANYNDAQYLHTSLEGVLSQTDPADEIIVVDDGSTDDSVELAERMLARHLNARVLKQGRNRGQHAAIQRALLEATSDYVVWASSDDLLLPEFIRKSRQVLTEHPGCGLCFSRLCAWREGAGEVMEYTEYNHGEAFDLGTSPRCYSPAALRDLLCKHYLWISGNTVLARRDLLLEMGGFNANLRWHGDWFSLYALALRAGACSIPETLAMMRERTNTYSASGMADSKRQRLVLRSILDTIKLVHNRDLLSALRRAPSLLSPFGGEMVWVALTLARHWDIGIPLFIWYAKRHFRTSYRRLRSG